MAIASLNPTPPQKKRFSPLEQKAIAQAAIAPPPAAGCSYSPNPIEARAESAVFP
ncbi:hypothetical protein [Thermosynechococcus sp.]|uniref:hypothetical protein n=1 Tax=Thermosynechococcus sp. TaxID=2814275 RepID=UPI00391A2018